MISKNKIQIFTILAIILLCCINIAPSLAQAESKVIIIEQDEQNELDTNSIIDYLKSRTADSNSEVIIIDAEEFQEFNNQHQDIIPTDFNSIKSSADSYRPYINSPLESKNTPSPKVYADLNTGAATFLYPINVPQGTNSLQPGLAISYSSLATNSNSELIGSSWFLTQSYIQRDVKYTPSDTSDDEFKLILNGNSQEMVYNSGNWHTKTETYLRIEKKSGGNNNNKEYWEITSKDGTTYRLGYNYDSESVSNLKCYTWKWYLDKVTDTNGNNIYYNYKENPVSGEKGATYPDKIEYNNEKSRKITFNYAPVSASWSIFSQGNEVKYKQRLREIHIYANNEIVRKYKIEYVSNTPATKFYVSKITEHGRDGSALPGTDFSYHFSEKGWIRNTDIQLPYTYFSYSGADGGSRLIDINRDGFTDILTNARAIIVSRDTYINNGTEFNIDSSYRPPEDARFVKYQEFLDRGVRIGDYNGDGYPDLIRGFEGHNGDDTSKDIWENTGSGWRKTSKQFVIKFTEEKKDYQGNYFTESNGVELVDFNGDGYVDVTQAREGEGKKSWINKNGNWAREDKWNLPSGIYLTENDGDDLGTRFIDINGDGFIDIYKSDDYGNHELWLNTGDGWKKDNEWSIGSLPDTIDAGNDDEGVRIMDVNGDGLPEFLRANGAERSSFINKGGSWELQSEWDTPEEAKFIEDDGNNEGTRIADINGDGSADIIRIVKKGGTVRMLWLNRGSRNSLLKRVKLPSGGKIIIEYENSAKTDSNLGFNLWIVKSISQEITGSMQKHHETNGNTDCVPQNCAGGYKDKGVDCSQNDRCIRTCEKSGCGSWNLIKDSKKDWSNFDFPKDAIGYRLFYYSSFNENKCYKVNTWSDNGIISSSDIYGEDSGESDSALALNWELGLNEQPWGSNCKPDATGDLINMKNYYLIDDSDTGDDFNSAEDLGGSWTGYCMPPSEGCAGYSPCTVDCYGRRWEFNIDAGPNMRKNYRSSDPDYKYGACRAKESSGSDGRTNYIHFRNDRYVGMKIWEANVEVVGTDNKICYKTPVKKISYEYSEGFYDYADREFRGFGHVTENLPDETKIKHKFHQDDVKKGLEYETEIEDKNNNPYKKTESEFTSQQTNGHYIVKLKSTKSYDYEGIATNPKITQTDYEYDNYGNPTKVSSLGDTSQTGDEKYSYSNYKYDANRWIVNRPEHTYLDNADSNKVREAWFDYNNEGNLIKEEYWLDTGQNPVISYGYNPYGSLIKETDANNHQTQYEYDSTNTFIIKTINAKHHETKYDYDLGTGNILSITNSNNYKTRYEYDTFGRKTKEFLPEFKDETDECIEELKEYGLNVHEDENQAIVFNSTLYFIHPRAFLIEVDQPAGINPVILAVTIDDYFNLSCANLLNKYHCYISCEDQQFMFNGDIYSYSDEKKCSEVVIDIFLQGIYPPRAKNKFKSKPNDIFKEAGKSEIPAKEIHYNFDGNAPEEIKIMLKENDSGTLDTVYFYDGFGNLIQEKRESGNSKLITTDHYYDESSRITKTSNPYYSNNGCTTPSNSVKKTSRQYDAIGRVTKITNPDGTEKTISYDYWKTEAKDENNHKKEYLSDAYGNIIEVKEYNQGEIYTTTYKYNTANSIEEIEDNQNNKIKYTYDRLGRKTKTEDSDLGMWTYEYGANGNLIEKEDSKSNIIQYEYDELDRIKKEITPEKTIRYTYDENKKGVLSKVEMPGLITEYDYDSQIRLIKEAKTIDSRTFTTEFTYDSLNRITTKTLPNSETITYTYNSQGRVDQINGVLSNINYNEADQITERDYSNGLKTEFIYASDNFRLSKIKTGNKQELSYQYDNVGNIIKINDIIDSKESAFEYDDLDRLTHAEKTGSSNSFNLDYVYDSIGNMLNIFSQDQDQNLTFIYSNKPVHAPTKIITAEKECELSLCDCKCHFKGQTPEELTGLVCGKNCYSLYNIKGCKLKNNKCELVTRGPNNLPNIPTIPYWPSSGNIGIPNNFGAHATDPDNDDVAYRFDWGNNNISDWTRFMPSGSLQSMSYTYSAAGTYYVKAQAKDTSSALSEWSDGHKIEISDGGQNNPPDKPNTPSGPSSGEVNISYKFETSAIDPDGDDIAYKFNWGDEITNWSPAIASGRSIYSYHSWSSSNSYYVKVQVKDINGALSEWSDGRKITISANEEWHYQEDYNEKGNGGGSCLSNVAATDGDWGTGVECGIHNSTLYLNYTKKQNSISAKWYVKGREGVNDFFISNISIPQECWDYYTDKLQLKIDYIYNNGRHMDYSCYNGNWNILESKDFVLGMPPWEDLYEEGIWWEQKAKKEILITDKKYMNIT